MTSDWRHSAAWREIARRSAFRNLAAFRAAPRCGAMRKRDGEPCQNPALAGRSRCRVHGGATPKGDAWHRPKWPNGKSPDAAKKLRRKLHDRDRAAAERERRLAEMTPEQRAVHAAWQTSHRPGSSQTRAADRERRRQNRAAREMMMQTSERDPSPEIQQLEQRAAEVREQIARLRTGTQSDDDEGVFG